MQEKRVVRFRCYPFVQGQKIYIEDGPRKGDWVVVDIGDRKVTLRCPVSGTEVTWNRFCYLVSE